jgi:hypothetical protein
LRVAAQLRTTVNGSAGRVRSHAPPAATLTTTSAAIATSHRRPTTIGRRYAARGAQWRRAATPEEVRRGRQTD